jgi:predicted dehydrogenase
MKVCVIGATGHINYVINGLKMVRQARLVGAGPGSSGESVEKVLMSATRQGVADELRLYGDYREMLDQVKPDVVAVACHFGDHAKVAAEVLRRGIHLFIEKPLATTLEDLYAMRELHARFGVQLSAMFGIRYTAPFLTAWQAVQEGAVGDIRLMHAQKSYKLGTRGPSFHRRETYGGTIPWVGIHAIDWLRWFSGGTFETVYASHSTRSNRGHGELETTAACHFTMSNDVMATVSIDYLRPEHADSHGDDRIRIAGSEGVLEVVGGRVWLTNGEQSGTRELPLLPEEEIFADFIRQIRSGAAGRVSAEDAFLSTEACLMARQSADERRLVHFSERMI